MANAGLRQKQKVSAGSQQQLTANSGTRQEQIVRNSLSCILFCPRTSQQLFPGIDQCAQRGDTNPQPQQAVAWWAESFKPMSWNQFTDHTEQKPTTAPVERRLQCRSKISLLINQHTTWEFLERQEQTLFLLALFATDALQVSGITLALEASTTSRNFTIGAPLRLCGHNFRGDVAPTHWCQHGNLTHCALMFRHWRLKCHHWFWIPARLKLCASG